MLLIVAIIDFLVFLVIGRVIIGNRGRQHRLFYSDWFIISSSVYFIVWSIIGFLNLMSSVIPANSILHLLIGFLILFTLEIITYKAPKGTKTALKDLLRAFSLASSISQETIRETRFTRYILMVLIMGYGYFIYKAISVPLREYDVLSYHIPLAIDFYRLGSLLPPPDRYWHFYFPANFETWLSTWLSIGRSKYLAIAQLVSIIPVGFLSYSLARALNASRPQAFLTSCVLLGAPIILFQSITPMNELFALPFLIGIILYSVEYTKHGKSLDAFMCGCSIALAIGTKYSFLTLLVSVPIAILIARILSSVNSQFQARAIVKNFLLSAIPIILIPSFWYIRNLLVKGNPFFPLEFSLLGSVIFKGIPTVFDPNFELNFVASRSQWLIYPLIEGRYSAVQGWGLAAGALGFIALITLLVREISRRESRDTSLFVISFIVISIALWWNLTQHEPRFLIFILPILATYSVKTFFVWRPIGRWGFLVLLFLVALTIGQSISTFKLDIREASYNNDFMAFYGLDKTFDEWRNDDIILMFDDTGYGHLLVYPLSGPKLSRRVITVGLGKIGSIDELNNLMNSNRSLIPDRIDHILYYFTTDEPRFDLSKIMNVKIDTIHHSTPKRGSFILSNPHKIYQYKIIDEN